MLKVMKLILKYLKNLLCSISSLTNILRIMFVQQVGTLLGKNRKFFEKLFLQLNQQQKLCLLTSS
jgi:hypothetical protein